MISLNIPNMSCGHCKTAVEKAISSVDPSASIALDLDMRHVVVTTDVDAARVMDALKNAGYPATETA
ncbi:heavy-metal-associated domain-containing protein [Roseobacter weihaiensis]|uniref:heavy-metal-associated domain-containing protein n=1 Tax=Roseobacter weihaiensis TaxID=2763262 RepID=UPI001D0B291B|nr:heavy-metal-associated domain-containing protein [Roseobacter sp. H9]